jgi:hypothetical protein
MTMTTETEAGRRQVVDGDDRADILRYASIMLAPSDRYHADRVAEMAAPLLEWAEQARDKTDLRLRMRAMHRQHLNTPMAYSRPPAVTISRRRFSWLGKAVSLSSAPDVWVAQSVITTPGRFLAEAAILHAFIAER